MSPSPGPAPRGTRKEPHHVTADSPTTPRLTALHLSLLILAIAGFAPLAAISFMGSFEAMETEAVRRGFPPDNAWLVPIGADAGIVGFSVLDLLLTGLRMPMPLLHHTVRMLTAATIWFNAAAGHDLVGKSMHALLPLLFIVYIEAWRHLVRRWTGQSVGIAREGIPLARWVAAPISTPRMKRRMILWGEGNYQRALDTEQSIRHAYAQLKNLYGDGWKRETPGDVLWMLRTGVRVDAACARVAELTERATAAPSPDRAQAEPAAPPSAETEPPQQAAYRPPASEAPDLPRPQTTAETGDTQEAPKVQPLPEGMTLQGVARIHYKKCKESGTAFDIKELQERYGGTPGHWRKIRNALIRELGPIDPSPSPATTQPEASTNGQRHNTEEQHPALQNV